MGPRIGGAELALIGVGVVAVSTSGPLIKEAEAPLLAVASWRNLLSLLPLCVLVAWRHRGDLATLDRRTRRLVVVSGLFLAGHFAAWVPSLGLTSVASSVALVCTQPVWAALITRLRGAPVGRRAWTGIAAAMAGVLVLAGVDLTVSGDALLGDALALLGGMLVAGYVLVGEQVRQTVANPLYGLGAYAVAGVAVAALALASGAEMTGYPSSTWLVLVALAIGPQLLGHSVFNRVLPAVGATVVSVAVLFEVVGAALLAWWWQGERPPLAAVPAAALILAGVSLVVTDRNVAMGIPIHSDGPVPPADLEAVVRDPETPDADAVEQATEVSPGGRPGPVTRDFETPENDAVDQALEVPFGDDDY